MWPTIIDRPICRQIEVISAAHRISGHTCPMSRPRTPARRRLGRPPAAESGATRDRILHAAREAFADLGYSATTNKALADNADVTTGAIYHYFDSKLDLYRAVNDEAQEFVYARFEAALADADNFVEGVENLLDMAWELNHSDPSLARFLGAVRIDVRRNPELRGMFKPATIRRERLILALADIGVATGELAAADRDRTVALLRAVLVGLVDVSDDAVAHLQAIDAFKALIKGDLVRSESAERKQTRAAARARVRSLTN
jgi:AcrR family transcriptional regulator